MAETIFFFALGLLLLALGADLLVRGASKLARTFGIPPIIVGLTIVAFGTSSPELSVSIKAALQGRPDLTLGNVVGSNILNILLILGVTALVRPLTVAMQFVKREVPILIVASLVVWVLALDHNISRINSALLLAMLLAYLLYSYFWSKKEPAEIESQFDGHIKAPTDAKLGWRLAYLALLIAGFVLLIVGADRLIKSAVVIANYLGLSELVIGLTVVAIGTSLPELATSVVATLRGEQDIAVANVIGSSIFNMLCILGIAGTIAPIFVRPRLIRFDMLIMMGVAVICYPIFRSQARIARWEGALLLSGYIVYTVFLFMFAKL